MKLSTFLGLARAWLAVATVVAGHAACDLQITSAGPCLPDGTEGNPAVGEPYALKVDFNVVGNPTQPFRIKFTLANVTWYSENLTWAVSGDGWQYRFVWHLNLDDSIPWSITLDPDAISGDTNFGDNSASGRFTPTPPATAVELYAPRVIQGSETYSLNFEPGSGDVQNLWILFGAPTSHGAQQVLSVTPPSGARRVITAPYQAPLYELEFKNVPAKTFQDTSYFSLRLWRMRVNPTILRQVSWAQVQNLSPEWKQWIEPDGQNQSQDPAIVNFVQESLPANYRSTMTPYDTARTLHKAVMKKLTYVFPPPATDALTCLQQGIADCGGYAALLTASLRNVGIPARRISGFWQGNSDWHVRTEFHLPAPGVEWVVADATNGNAEDPTGTYAFGFGYVSNSDQYVAVDVGDQHQMPYYNFPMVQVPNWWWTGGANFISYTCASFSTPVFAMFGSKSSTGSFDTYLSDVPATGSVVIEQSSDLSTWNTVKTIAATGEPMKLSFPGTDSGRTFYRARAEP